MSVPSWATQGLLARRMQLLIRRDPAYLLELARAGGEVITARWGPWSVALLSHPDAMRAVLADRHQRFTKGGAYARGRGWLGDGLLVSAGASHRLARRVLQPAFTPTAAQGHAAAIVAQSAELSGRWRDGEQRDLVQEMRLLATTLTLQIVAGADQAAEAAPISAALDTMGAWFQGRGRALWALHDRLGAGEHQAVQLARTYLDDLVETLIEARRARRDGTDALALLVRAEAAGAPARFARDQLITLLFAGRETVAAALSWAWYLLASDPGVERTLHAEIDHVLAGRAPTAADLPHLPTTRAIVAESLRCYPPAWLATRRAGASCTVGDTSIPAGGLLLMSPYVVHHDRRCFPAPEAFAPERWAGLVGRERRHPAFLPFGAGPRRCIGEALAWVEAVLALATIGQRWVVRRCDQRPLTLTGGSVLEPAGGLPMLVRRRAGG